MKARHLFFLSFLSLGIVGHEKWSPYHRTVPQRRGAGYSKVAAAPPRCATAQGRWATAKWPPCHRAVPQGAGQQQSGRRTTALCHSTGAQGHSKVAAVPPRCATTQGRWATAKWPPCHRAMPQHRGRWATAKLPPCHRAVPQHKGAGQQQSGRRTTALCHSAGALDTAKWPPHLRAVPQHKGAGQEQSVKSPGPKMMHIGFLQPSFQKAHVFQKGDRGTYLGIGVFTSRLVYLFR